MSSLPEVDKPYRKSDYRHRKWSYYMNRVWKCRRVVTTRHELTGLVTSKCRLDFMSRNALADERNKTRSHAMYTSFCKLVQWQAVEREEAKTSDRFQQNARAGNKTVHPNKKPCNVYLVL